MGEYSPAFQTQDSIPLATEDWDVTQAGHVAGPLIPFPQVFLGRANRGKPSLSGMGGPGMEPCTCYSYIPKSMERACLQEANRRGAEMRGREPGPDSLGVPASNSPHCSAPALPGSQNESGPLCARTSLSLVQWLGRKRVLGDTCSIAKTKEKEH